MTRSVLDKLGWTPGRDAAAIGVPENLESLFTPLEPGEPDSPIWRIQFVADVAAATAAAIGPAVEDYREGGWLWFAYPKKTGALKTDISRDHGWDALLAQDFLPVTQVALDDTWSALRFRLRGEIKTLTRKF
jgi:hypothetical protein